MKVKTRTLYKLVNGKFELVNDYSEVGYQYGLIIYNDGTNKYLINTSGKKITKEYDYIDYNQNLKPINIYIAIIGANLPNNINPNIATENIITILSR